MRGGEKRKSIVDRCSEELGGGGTPSLYRGLAEQTADLSLGRDPSAAPRSPGDFRLIRAHNDLLQVPSLHLSRILQPSAHLLLVCRVFD